MISFTQLIIFIVILILIFGDLKYLRSKIKNLFSQKQKKEKDIKKK